MSSQVRTELRGTSPVYVLEDTTAGSSACVLPGYGFNCFSFRVNVRGNRFEVIQADSRFAEDRPKASRNGIPILFPFPNRIRDGRFQFNGRAYELERNERGVNAIHGMVINRAWRVTDSTGDASNRATVAAEFQLSRDAVELTSRWPADFVLAMSYTLEGNRLTSRIRVTNPDTKPLPWGFGTHPYFRLPLATPGDESRCRVFTPASRLWLLDNLIPTGQRSPVPDAIDVRAGRSLAGLQLDHVFTDLEFREEWCTCRLVDESAGAELQVRFDRLFREAVLFTPANRGAVCIEPYTCTTDAINLQPQGIDAGLRVLEPGESAEGTIVMEAV